MAKDPVKPFSVASASPRSFVVVINLPSPHLRYTIGSISEGRQVLSKNAWSGL